MNLKKIALIIVIIIIVSVIIIAGINYMKKKPINKGQTQAPKLTSEAVDTTGMETYLITFPFSYQNKYSDYLDAIKEAKYSFDKEYVTNDDKGPKDINIQIKISPKDIQGITDILTKLNQEIKVIKL